MRYPSQDWDDYHDEQERSAESERRFYQTNADRLVVILAALIAREPPGELISNRKRLLVDEAAKIVAEVVNRGADL